MSATALKALTADMAKGSIATLIMLGGNPVYDSPADVDFRGALAKVGFSLHLSAYRDETSRASTWHVPASHYLETWGDARRWDGTITIVQPLIKPLYASWTKSELLSVLVNGKTGDDRLVAETITLASAPAPAPAPAAETQTEEAVAAEAAPVEDTRDPELKALKLMAQMTVVGEKVIHRGFIEGTAYPLIDTEIQAFAVANWPKVTMKASDTLQNGEFEVAFFEDGKVHDGRYANNGWLQETPDTLSKLTWDNAALVSLKTAKKLGLVEEDVISIKVGSETIEAAVSVLPGQATGTVALAFGYGRSGSWCCWWLPIAGHRQPRCERLRASNLGRAMASNGCYHCQDRKDLHASQHSRAPCHR